jgi:hypothetical protein
MTVMQESFSEYELTPDQSAVLGALEQLLVGKQCCFLLKGYAGTGKTFLMQGVTRYLRDAEVPFRLLAPTGRAAKVISQKTKCPASTMHKAIYMLDDLKEYKVKDVEGSETYKYYFDLAHNEDDARTVYIVDEASMISNVYSEGEFFRFGSGHLLDDFVRFVNLDNNDHQKKIIFIGDSAQLPPVGSCNSPALDESYLAEKYRIQPQCCELTEVVRQKSNSGILANATAIRERIKKSEYNVLDIDLTNEDVASLKVSDLLDTYVAACASSSDQDTVIVAYSNRQVKDYNDIVRQHRFPGCPTVCRGDRVLVVHNNYGHQIPLLNGEFGEVVEVEEDVETRTAFLNKPIDGKRVNIPIDLSFRWLVVRFPDLGGRLHDIRFMVSENLLNSKERDLSSDECKALYVDFKERHRDLKSGTPEFKETIKNDPYFNCLQLKFGYAVTCHKAQGGEWQHVFVDFSCPGGYFNEAYFRWAYTAITRAQARLYGLNTPHFGILTATDDAADAPVEAQRDVICVPADAIVGDLGFEMPVGSLFSRALFCTVHNLIENDVIVISELAQSQHCEHYTFSRADGSATAFVDYKGDETVSHVRWKNGSHAELQAHLTSVLATLEGKQIVVVGDTAVSADVKVDIPEGVSYLAEFYEAIQDKATEANVSIVEVTHPTAYLGRYVFQKEGLRACVDYTFNGKGRLKLERPGPKKSTTSDELLREVLGFGSGERGMLHE